MVRERIGWRTVCFFQGLKTWHSQIFPGTLHLSVPDPVPNGPFSIDREDAQPLPLPTHNNRWTCNESVSQFISVDIPTRLLQKSHVP